MTVMQKAVLALEDGTIFHGKSFGYKTQKQGELVFNTSMTGYQEVVTDPSYSEQIVMFTYPLIGNYGVNDTDVESDKVQVKGVVVRDYVEAYSNCYATMSFGDYLRKNKIVGITGIDTRALTRHIRMFGSMKAVVSVGLSNCKDLIKKAKQSPDMKGRNLVKNVTCSDKYVWGKKAGVSGRVVVMDFGVKHNILRILSNLGFEVIVVPANTKACEVLDLNPNGILLSNGPGDPAAVKSAILEVKKLINKKPIFGICLGHQILALAMGAKTYKLKFGHRGANHPVKDLETGRIYITSQNHGFSVDIKSLKNKPVKIIHMNLYDNTLEGMEHKSLPVFSVQYHPEANPGPNDTEYLFSKFKERIKRAR